MGDEDNIDGSFVRKHLEVLYFDPIKNMITKDSTEASHVFTSVFESVVKRFEQADTLKTGFTSIEEFLICFDLACADFAAVDHNLSESDFRGIANDHDLINS